MEGLYHGDCLEIMKQIPDGSVDMVFCDLPYGTTDCTWDVVIPFERLWEQYKRVCRSRAALIFTASQPFTSLLVSSNIEWFRVEWIWRKNAGSNFATTKWYPMKEHESVLVFGDGPTTFNPIKQPRAKPIKAGYTNNSNTGKRKAYSGVTHNKGFTVTDGKMRVPSSVQNWNRERGLHPNQKPVALIEYFIRTYSNEGDLVLDNCIGSGTTAIAAINTKRRWVGIESNDEYVCKAADRIEAHGGIVAPSSF